MTSPRTDRTDWTECEIRGNGEKRDWCIFIPTFPSDYRTREWDVPESSLRKFPDKNQSVAMSDLSDIWTPEVEEVLA